MGNWYSSSVQFSGDFVSYLVFEKVDEDVVQLAISCRGCFELEPGKVLCQRVFSLSKLSEFIGSVYLQVWIFEGVLQAGDEGVIVVGVESSVVHDPNISFQEEEGSISLDLPFGMSNPMRSLSMSLSVALSLEALLAMPTTPRTTLPRE